MGYGRKFSGPLLPGTTSVKQVNRRNRFYKKGKFSPAKPVYTTASTNPPVSVKAKANTNSIVQLQRDVKNLKLSQIGPYQKQVQYLNLDNTLGQVVGYSNIPIAFQVNDFTETNKIFTANTTTFVTSAVQRTGTDISFAKQNTHFNVPATFKYDPFWASTSDDHVSNKRYLPIKASFLFSVSQRMQVTDPNAWVRIDFITPKKVLPETIAHSLNLPSGLYSMSHLAEDEMQNRNKINTQYWRHICKTKWIQLKSLNATTDTLVDKHYSKTIYFPKKVIECEIDTPGISNDSIFTNIPRKQAIWCVISFNGMAGSSNKLSIRRVIHYRDNEGKAN